MQLSDWFTVGVSLVVGLGSAWIGARASKAQHQLATQRERILAFRRYERALRDVLIQSELRIKGAPGAHFPGRKEDLREARDAFYPYIHEFDGNDIWYSLNSPFSGWEPGDDPSYLLDFYSDIIEALKKHVEEYPKPQNRSPYLKKVAKDDA